MPTSPLAYFRKIGQRHYRSLCLQHRLVREAEFFVGKFGEAFLERIPPSVEAGPDGRLRSVAKPDRDERQELAGSKAAGFYLAEKQLRKGDHPYDVRRKVIAKAHKLATTWPAMKEAEEAAHLRAWQGGNDMAIERHEQTDPGPSPF